MKKNLSLLVCLVLSLSSILCAETNAPKKMDDIDILKYEKFYLKWKQVTVRFRKDTGEMRFTFANPLAYKTLKKGLITYPDGAVFGKVAVATVEDSLFVSSVIPNGARRYQLMVKDAKKYKNNHGWGYALYDEKGNLFPEDPKSQVMACAACHNAAEERGYVFSQRLNLDQTSSQAIIPGKGKSAFIFETIEKKKLDEKIMALLPEQVKYVRVLKASLSDNLFQGTLDEIRPTLSKETFESKYPSLLLSKDQKRFSLILWENMSAQCTNQGKNGAYLKSVYSNIEQGKNIELHFCYTP